MHVVHHFRAEARIVRFGMPAQRDGFDADEGAEHPKGKNGTHGEHTENHVHQRWIRRRQYRIEYRVLKEKQRREHRSGHGCSAAQPVSGDGKPSTDSGHGSGRNAKARVHGSDLTVSVDRVRY